MNLEVQPGEVLLQQEAELKVFTDVTMSIPESDSRRDELRSSVPKKTPALSLCSYMIKKGISHVACMSGIMIVILS